MSEVVAVSTGQQTTKFEGFESLDANFIYCPNQFLDLCLKHCTRSEVRAIAYVLVETLQFRDEAGNPTRQDIVVPYEDFSTIAGISPRSAKVALEGAVKKGFLFCKQKPQPKRKGQPAQSGIYALAWDYTEEYSTSLSTFEGFFAGEGRRSPLPVEFFRLVIPDATLSAIRVTGTVLRHTLGYQAQFGRRQQASLPYDSIQAHSGIKDRKDVTRGIEESVKANYISVITPGVFHADADKRTPSVYGPKWLGLAKKKINAAKNPLADPGKKPTSSSGQNTHQEGGKIPTRNDAQNPPGNAGKKPTSRKTEDKYTSKQQAVVARLLEEEITTTAIDRLIEEIELDQIDRQLSWIDYRESTSNRAGMLVRAIKEDWGEPKQLQEARAANELKAEQDKQEAECSIKSTELDKNGEERQRDREERWARQTQFKEWEQADIKRKQAAYEHAISNCGDPAILTAIHNSTPEEPHIAVLDSLSKILCTQ